MEEKNELGDIILNNKNNKEGGSKKIILAAATLGIILIIVVLLMNTLNSENENNLPQNALPPKPVKEKAEAAITEEPLFEDVEVIDEKGENEDAKLEKIAQELKKQTIEQIPQTEDVAPTKAKTTSIQKKQIQKKKETPKKSTIKGHYYVQVGSFTKYKPSKSFLTSIKKEGYNYTFYRANVHGKQVTKVLVGPFRNEKEARNALKKIRMHIEKGAFLTKL